MLVIVILKIANWSPQRNKWRSSRAHIHTDNPLKIHSCSSVLHTKNVQSLQCAHAFLISLLHCKIVINCNLVFIITFFVTEDPAVMTHLL